MTGGTPPFHDIPPGGAPPGHVWWLRAADGVRLRAALWEAPNARGHAILLQGRTEFLEKKSLPAAELVARGYSVISLDWRGQGLSDRRSQPAAKGHVRDFGEFQTDLDALLASEEAEALSGPRVLVAHSMGGLIGAVALDRPPLRDTVQAAVLSAPLFGILLPAWMRAFAWATMATAKAIGRTERWPPMGDVETTYVLTDPPENVLTSDPEIWDWMVASARAYPELTLGLPSIAWFDAAVREIRRLRRMRAPACPALCLLGTREQVVQPNAIHRWTARTGAGLEILEGARHEPFAEAPPIRAAAWAAIDRFLEDHLGSR